MRSELRQRVSLDESGSWVFSSGNGRSPASAYSSFARPRVASVEVLRCSIVCMLDHLITLNSYSWLMAMIRKLLSRTPSRSL
jgi:hypothetical protein